MDSGKRSAAKTPTTVTIDLPLAALDRALNYHTHVGDRAPTSDPATVIKTAEMFLAFLKS